MTKPNGTPRVPTGLSPDSARVWRELMREFELDDAAALLLLTTALEARDRMRAAAEIVAREGLMVEDVHGKRAHPALAIERLARRAMLESLRALNLDIEPLRDRVGRPPGVRY
jgi:hypothetical protein